LKVSLPTLAVTDTLVIHLVNGHSLVYQPIALNNLHLFLPLSLSLKPLPPPSTFSIFTKSAVRPSILLPSLCMDVQPNVHFTRILITESVDSNDLGVVVFVLQTLIFFRWLLSHPQLPDAEVFLNQVQIRTCSKATCSLAFRSIRRDIRPFALCPFVRQFLLHSLFVTFESPKEGDPVCFLKGVF
jgi:hypothetical protein